MLPPLLALSGRAGSGKSTAAAVLQENGYELVKFAGPLKDMMRALYAYSGLTAKEIEDRIEGRLKEQPDSFLCGNTPRRAMQTLGTEWARDMLGQDLWVEAWKRAVTRLRESGVPVVVDDCRFANEAAAVRSLGGEIVMLQGRSSNVADSHASELFDFTPDQIFTNCGTRTAFEAAIYEAFVALPEDDTAPNEREAVAKSFRDTCESLANEVSAHVQAGNLDAAADLLADFRHGFGLDGSEAEAEAIDGGPYAEIWDSRARANSTREAIQQAVSALYSTSDRCRRGTAMAEIARAHKHIGKHNFSEFTPAERLCLLFYVDCIAAGLPFDPEGMDDFLGGLGIETPSLPL